MTFIHLHDAESHDDAQAVGLLLGVLVSGTGYLWQSLLSIVLYFVYENAPHHKEAVAAVSRWYLVIHSVFLPTLYRFIAIVIVGRFCYQRHKSKRREAIGIIEDLPEEMLDMTGADLDEDKEPAELDPDNVLELADLRSWKHTKQYHAEDDGMLRSERELLRCELCC